MKFNVTSISNIVYLDSLKEYEESLNSSSYSDFTLFIVKAGDSQTIVYYGRRQLKDVLVVDSGPPTLSDSPINKVYLVVCKDRYNQYFIKDVYYKYLLGPRNPKVAKLSEEYFKIYIEPTEESLWTFKVVFSNEDEAVMLAADSQGLLSSSSLNSIKSGLSDELKELELHWSNW